SLPIFGQRKVNVSVLRLDKLHPVISGNKWFKLRYYMVEALQQGKKRGITFGGTYSNQIIATAAACQLYGLQSAGIIRGEQPVNFSPTLLQAKELGMQLLFTSREDYAAKKMPLSLTHEDYYIIPEGGYGATGAKGAATIMDYCSTHDFTHICCAVGTGTMMAGLMNASLPDQFVIGISVMKNNRELEDSVRSLLLDKQQPIRLLHDYHW